MSSMFRAGYVYDPNHAVSLCKTLQEEPLATGFILSGFGTKSMPGQICDDAIQKVVQFAAHHLQNVLSALLKRKCMDVDYAASVITKQLGRIHDGISYFNRNVGQGAYLAGVVCYMAGDQFVCLPFGGAAAYFWESGKFTPLKNEKVKDKDPKYIWDALGGGQRWDAVFQKGTIPAGAQLLCMSQAATEEVFASAMQGLLYTNQEYVASTLYDGISNSIAKAVLVFFNATTHRKEAP